MGGEWIRWGEGAKFGLLSVEIGSLLCETAKMDARLALANVLGEVAMALPAALGGSVPPLPKPPALEHYLYESPWLLILLIVGLLVVVSFTLNRQGRARGAMVAAVVGVVASAGVYGVSAAVQTPREVVSAQTRELVDLVARADVAGVDPMIHPEGRLLWLGGRMEYSKAQLLERIESDLKRTYPLRSWRILKLQATQDGPSVARTQVQVRVETESAGLNFSWWRMDWQRVGARGEWRLVGIEPLFISGMSR